MTRRRLRVRENPAASEDMRAKTYWHGSPRTEAAESILREGLRPPPSVSRGHVAPRGGHVYLTPHLSYAIIYTVGGHLSCGNSPGAIAAIIKRHGRYGYLFEVAGQALSRVEPDEDSVGEAVSEAMDMARGHSYPSEEALRVALQADPVFARALLEFARKAMTPRQLDGIRVGFSAAESSGGKRALRTMPDWMKMRLLTMGAHVAHHGSLPTRSAWRFDRSKMPVLRMDGANFFDLAERLDRPSPRDNPARGTTYTPDFSAPAEGMWVRDPGPAWVQHHRALVAAALRSWSGSPAEMKLHIDDVGAGAPVPGNGTGKMMRAQAEALAWELAHGLKRCPRALYRGSHVEPRGVQSWTTRRKVAERWAARNGGRLWTLPAGTLGLRRMDYASTAFDEEAEWLVDSP